MKKNASVPKKAALEIRKIRNAVNDIIEIYSSSINAKLSDAIKTVESLSQDAAPKKSDITRLEWIIKRSACVKVKPGKGRPKDLTKINKFAVLVLARLRDRSF
jgi:hypothetical protein